MPYILQIIGATFVLSPVFLYWFIHGNYERYVWIINNPFPFSHLGSAIFQVLLSAGLIITGIIFIILSFIISQKKK